MRQISKTRRRLAAGAFFIIAAPVVASSVAYACQSLATLHANPRTAAAGSSVTVFGKGYASGTTNSQIEIHLDGRNGRVIGTFAPTSILNGAVTIPADVQPGTHTLVATQYTAAGNAVSGTPGRASVVVNVAGRSTGEGVAPATATSADPVTATPAAATAATPAASAPAAAAASTGSAAPATATAAPAAAAAPATAAAAPAAAATVAAAEESTPAAGPASVNVGLLPASAESSSSPLPGIALAAGFALVLLGLGAFVKSGRNLLGRGFTPLA